MRILVTGAGGFIGAAIVEALDAAGHEVIACLRPESDAAAGGIGHRQLVVDMREAVEPGAWRPLLAGIDAVVNCAGILREGREGDFARIHHDAPLALATACREAGIGKFVQVSALGDEAGGEFIASKHRFDAALLALGIPATVIRPSVVTSARGSHGGTSLLRGMAALPGVVFLPGRGDQRIQPVMREDLAGMVARCVAPEIAKGKVLHAVGPDVLTLREYLATVRRWLGFAEPVFVEAPSPLVRVAVGLGERFGAGPLGATIGAMLDRGNVAPPGAWEEARDATGVATRAIAVAMGTSPSLVQDRWHARLHLLRPALRGVMAATWIASGAVGFAASPEAFAPIANALGVPAPQHAPLVLAASALDVVLGALLLTRWEGAALALMAISVAAYTAALGVTSPALWAEPTGGLLKNFALLGLVAVLAATRGRR